MQIENGVLRSDERRAAVPRLLWQTKIGTSYGGARPHTTSERVFAWDEENFLVIFHPQTGEMIERHTALGRLAHKLILIDGPLVIVAKRDAHSEPEVCAYNWQDNRLVWKQRSEGEMVDLALGQSAVFAVTRDGTITAVARTDGTFRWSHRLRRPIFWSPRLLCGGPEIYIAADGKAGFGTPTYADATLGYVLSLDSSSGDLRWIYCTGGEISHPAVLAGNRIYVGDSGSHHRHIYCLTTSPRTRLGERVWSFDLGGLANCGAVAGDVAYWGCYDHHLYALDANNGRLKWRFRARGPVANYGPPCVLEDWVLVAASDGYLYGLDARNGALRWKFFVTDDEPQRADRAKQQVLSSRDGNNDDEEAREQREWSASLNREKSEAQQETEQARQPSPPGLVVWSVGPRVYLLSDQGLLHCFAAPGVSL